MDRYRQGSAHAVQRGPNLVWRDGLAMSVAFPATLSWGAYTVLNPGNNCRDWIRFLVATAPARQAGGAEHSAKPGQTNTCASAAAGTAPGGHPAHEDLGEAPTSSTR